MVISDPLTVPEPHREPAAEDLKLGGRSLDVIGRDSLFIFSISLRPEALQQLLSKPRFETVGERGGRKSTTAMDISLQRAPVTGNKSLVHRILTVPQVNNYSE